MAAWLTGTYRDDRLLVEAGGSWTLTALSELDGRRRRLLAEAPAGGGAASIDLGAVEKLDTAGAWLLDKLDARTGRAAAGRSSGPARAMPMPACSPRSAGSRAEPLPPAPAVNPLLRMIAHLGRGTLWPPWMRPGVSCPSMARPWSRCPASRCRPSRLRLTSLTHHLEQTCLNALPIVGLISFLIGIVMAYQGADQLRRFGAEIFTVDLVGISVLREIGILLTAIVVAGRSGSAFTAQIGTMKVSEEVDALRTLGLDPIEVLVLPRLLALMIALPLLAFFADIMALLGGGLMCALALDISPASTSASSARRSGRGPSGSASSRRRCSPS